MDVLNFFNGFKTFIGGLVLIAGGAAGMGFGVIDPATGIMLIGNGFGVWGIGDKIQKQTNVFKDFEGKVGTKNVETKGK